MSGQMKRGSVREFRRVKIGLTVLLVIAVTLALATTPRGMLIWQPLVGIGNEFQIGRAKILRPSQWVVMDLRGHRGKKNLRLGVFPGGNRRDLPEGRFYSFLDTELDGSATFIELGAEEVARLRTEELLKLGCRQIDAPDRALIYCPGENSQGLIYDLGLSYVVGISPATDGLLAKVVSVLPADRTPP